MENNQELEMQEKFDHFEHAVISKYGLLMSTTDLVDALGFSSLSSLRQACRRNKVNLQMFKINGRAGRFALSVDVANYLWSLRNEGEVKTK